MAIWQVTDYRDEKRRSRVFFSETDARKALARIAQRNTNIQPEYPDENTNPIESTVRNFWHEYNLMGTNEAVFGWEGWTSPLKRAEDFDHPFEDVHPLELFGMDWDEVWAQKPMTDIEWETPNEGTNPDDDLLDFSDLKDEDDEDELVVPLS